jgi:Cu(I)/Ag(I) efflux system membrane fusion protein
VVPNADLRLKPGMYASLKIAWKSPQESVLVPREAVIDTGERQVVFLSPGQGRFEPREVKTGRSGEEGIIEVLSGLSGGETVVVSGQFLLDSESRLREAVRKYAAGAAPKSGQIDERPTSPPPKRAASAAPTPPEMAPRLDEVFAAYLVLSDALGALQTKDTPLDPQPLIIASWTLHSAARSPDDKEMVLAVFKAAQGLSGKTLDKQREQFVPLGEAMLRLARVHPPSAKLSPMLYVMHCPMVQGHWLQKSDKLANPFYPSTMKDCGDIEERIEGRP